MFNVNISIDDVTPHPLSSTKVLDRCYELIEEFEDIVISFDDDEAPAIEQTPVGNSAEATYKLLLETVWIDDILDPSEVELLARKRGELGLSFERHLQLVRGIIGG